MLTEFHGTVTRVATREAFAQHVWAHDADEALRLVRLTYGAAIWSVTVRRAGEPEPPPPEPPTPEPPPPEPPPPEPPAAVKSPEPLTCQLSLF